ncbi:hypothetical protein ACGYLO_11465 [Sulfitobacter sp. 1A13353]|uniref:hypothetical protein n=1 Tax=Sulfitobacter sp. 1A13353 TaxID=3368568 RepID=UPI003744EAAF
MFHIPDPTISTKHQPNLRMARFNGTETLVKRFAAHEVGDIRERLEASGIDPKLLDDFEKRSKALMVRAIHQSPDQLREDVDVIAKRMSRSTLSGSRRADIEDLVSRQLMSGVSRVHDKAMPAQPKDPFQAAPARENNVTPEYA